MPKGIPNCLLVNTQSEIKLRISEELTYLGASEYTRLNLLHAKTLGFLTQEGECWTVSVWCLHVNFPEDAQFNM